MAHIWLPDAEPTDWAILACVSFRTFRSARTLVCAREDGEPKKPDSFTSWFIHLICRLRDFPRIRFHDLRHTHATQLLAAGVHPKVVQERLGHSSISVTMDVYSHVTPGLQADAVAKLDSAFGDQNRDHSRVERA